MTPTSDLIIRAVRYDALLREEQGRAHKLMLSRMYGVLHALPPLGGTLTSGGRDAAMVLVREILDTYGEDMERIANLTPGELFRSRRAA